MQLLRLILFHVTTTLVLCFSFLMISSGQCWAKINVGDKGGKGVLFLIVFLCLIILFLVLNITQRRRAARALRQIEARQRAILDNIPDAAWLKDKDGKYVAVNEALCNLAGMKAVDLMGKTAMDTPLLFDSGSRGENLMVVAECAAAQGERRIDVDGKGARWFDVAVSPLCDSEGHVFGSVGIARDITERKNVELALEKSEAMLRSVLSASPVGIGMLTGQNAIAWMNDGISIITGYTANELQGEGPKILYDNEDEYNRALKEFYRKIEETGGGELDTKWIRKTGRAVDVHVNAAALDQSDPASGIVVIVTDITFRKEAEKKLMASLHEKEVLLKEIHHRVKNNLQIISSLLNLQSSHIKDSQVLDMFRESVNRIRTMAHIHEKLYRSGDYARINFGGYIDELVSQLYNSYGFSTDSVVLKSRINDITVDISTAIPLGLIVNELVSNALKHAFPGGRKGEIDIILKDRDGNITLSVADNGVGFPSEIDFRNARTLGLQLIVELVEQVEGEIELIRQGKTKFVIKLHKDREAK